MKRNSICPYTKSGKWPDEALVKIIEDTLKKGNPKCPKCNVEGEYHGYSEVSWLQCPNCGGRIGRTNYN